MLPELPNNNPYFNEKKILSKKMKKLQKQFNAEEVKEEANNVPGVKAVSPISFGFYKIMTFLFFIFIVGSFIFFGYLIKSDKLNGVIQSTFNQTTNIQVDNTYDINVPVENNYDNKFNNNFTIYNNVICP